MRSKGGVFEIQECDMKSGKIFQEMGAAGRGPGHDRCR